MREGYTLLKSIEILQNELQPINDDDDNQILTELIEQYHEQMKSYDTSYVELITTLRQIQMNVNKFDHSCQEIEYTIKQQRTLFEQFIDSNQNILPDNLNQQIQMLKTLQREIETQTNSMIETLGQTTKETPISQMKIEQLTNDNDLLKSAILVSLFIQKNQVNIST
jgi:predicted RNase H-like nuclease (RuvC/YqgF family)